MKYIEIKDHDSIYRREFPDVLSDELTINRGLMMPMEDDVACADALDACLRLLRCIYPGKDLVEAIGGVVKIDYRD